MPRQLPDAVGDLAEREPRREREREVRRRAGPAPQRGGGLPHAEVLVELVGAGLEVGARHLRPDLERERRADHALVLQRVTGLLRAPSRLDLDLHRRRPRHPAGSAPTRTSPPTSRNGSTERGDDPEGQEAAAALPGACGPPVNRVVGGRELGIGVDAQPFASSHDWRMTVAAAASTIERRLPLRTFASFEILLRDHRREALIVGVDRHPLGARQPLQLPHLVEHRTGRRALPAVEAHREADDDPLGADLAGGGEDRLVVLVERRRCARGPRAGWRACWTDRWRRARCGGCRGRRRVPESRRTRSAARGVTRGRGEERERVVDRRRPSGRHPARARRSSRCRRRAPWPRRARGRRRTRPARRGPW